MTILRSRVHYAIAVTACLMSCLAVAGMLRHFTRPDEHPLNKVSTYRPGFYVYRTWLEWTAMSKGDFRPIYVASVGRHQDPDYSMYRKYELEEHRAAFVYTPIAALLISPLATPDSDYDAVADVVSIVNHALGLIGSALLFSILMRGRQWRKIDIGMAVAHVAAYYPLAKALNLTQAGVWMFFLVCCAMWLFDRGHRFSGGLVLAFGCSIKPHLVLIPIVVAMGGRFPTRALLGCGLGLILSALVCLTYAGPANLVDYMGQLRHLSSGYAYAPNQSFNGLLLRMFTDQDPSVFNLAEPVLWIRVLSTGLGLGLVAAAVWACRRGAKSSDPDAPLLRLGGATAAVVVASPICWYHHLVLLAGPMVIGWRTLVQNQKTTAALALPMLVGCCLSSVYFDAAGAPAIFSGLPLYGALIVVGCLLTMIVRQR